MHVRPGLGLFGPQHPPTVSLHTHREFSQNSSACVSFALRRTPCFANKFRGQSPLVSNHNESLKDQSVSVELRVLF
jgi:hypothetical protein